MEIIRTTSACSTVYSICLNNHSTNSRRNDGHRNNWIELSKNPIVMSFGAKNTNNDNNRANSNTLTKVKAIVINDSRHLQTQLGVGWNLSCRKKEKEGWQSLAGSKGRRLANASTANPRLISPHLISARPGSGWLGSSAK